MAFAKQNASGYYDTHVHCLDKTDVAPSILDLRFFHNAMVRRALCVAIQCCPAPCRNILDLCCGAGSLVPKILYLIHSAPFRAEMFQRMRRRKEKDKTLSIQYDGIDISPASIALAGARHCGNSDTLVATTGTETSLDGSVYTRFFCDDVLHFLKVENHAELAKGSAAGGTEDGGGATTEGHDEEYDEDKLWPTTPLTGIDDDMDVLFASELALAPQSSVQLITCSFGVHYLIGQMYLDRMGEDKSLPLDEPLLKAVISDFLQVLAKRLSEEGVVMLILLDSDTSKRYLSEHGGAVYRTPVSDFAYFMLQEHKDPKFRTTVLHDEHHFKANDRDYPPYFYGEDFVVPRQLFRDVVATSADFRMLVDFTPLERIGASNTLSMIVNHRREWTQLKDKKSPLKLQRSPYSVVILRKRKPCAGVVVSMDTATHEKTGQEGKDTRAKTSPVTRRPKKRRRLNV